MLRVDQGENEETNGEEKIEEKEKLNEIPKALPEQIGRLCTQGWVATYLKYTQNQASPQRFHLWTALSVIAGVLRRNVYINRGGYYTLYPNLYTVLVAPTGRCMKSTAAAIGVRLLRKIDDVKIMHEKITPEGLISYMAGSLDGQKPSLKKVFSGKNVVVREECNCFIFAPELSVFLGGVSYTAGLIELLTSLYEGKDRWEYRTKTHGESILNNVNVNLFGCSNPEWLAKGFSEDAFGGGFMGRTIYVFQDEGKKIAWPRKPKGMDELELKLMNDLIQMSELCGEYIVAQSGIDFYEDWYNTYKGDFTGRMAGYYERKPDHILKLGMILAAARSNSLVVTEDDLRAALFLLDDVEKDMPSAFAYIGATNEARISQHILEKINHAPMKFMSYRKLIDSVRHLIRHRREFDDIMDTLVTSGTIKIQVTNNTKYFWLAGAEVQQLIEVTEAAGELAARQELTATKQQDLGQVVTTPQDEVATLKAVLENAIERIKT
jgi:hypothetical protein